MRFAESPDAACLASRFTVGLGVDDLASDDDDDDERAWTGGDRNDREARGACPVGRSTRFPLSLERVLMGRGVSAVGGGAVGNVIILHNTRELWWA